MEVQVYKPIVSKNYDQRKLSKAANKQYPIMCGSSWEGQTTVNVEAIYSKTDTK